MAHRRLLFNFATYTVLMILVMAVQLGLVAIAPYPFNKVNLIFSCLVLALMLTDSGAVVWLAFAFHFFIELYTLTPFGIVLLAGTITMLLLYWFYKSIFTNRTIVAAISLSVLAIILDRLIYSVLLAFTGWIGDTATLSWAPLVAIYGWELIFTVITTVVFYILIAQVSSRFNFTVIR